jgi:hypothetical protein
MPPLALAADNTPRRRCSRAAAKVKAHRQRQRAGLTVLRVPVLQYETAQYLIDTGRLTVAEALDPSRVAHAIGQIVAELAERWSKV